MNSLIIALQNFGLLVSEIIADGEVHRCPTRDKPRKKNGWYVAFENGEAACYGDWGHGDESHFWKADRIDEQALYRVRRNVEDLKKKREDEQLALADNALDFWESLERKGHSDYLVRKNLNGSHGLRFDGNNVLVMPLQDSGGKIWSYQKIYGDGEKRFMQGGRVKGCYYLIGHPLPTERVVVCEGFATGATIHEETGLAVVVALNTGNIKPVCDSLPFTDILIAADNDTNGVGQKAAKESGYPFVAPDAVGDFNDIPRSLVRGYFIEEAAAPTDAIQVHGLVGEIADWITATAIRPQPLLSLAAALSFVGMIKGHRVRGYTNLRTNLLVLAMAPTAGGKEHPQNAIKRLVKAAGLTKHLMGEAVSGAGFLHGLQKAGNVGYMVMDEVGRYLGNLSSASAGVHQKEIIDYIIKTSTCANSILMGREKAPSAKEPRIDIDQPHFCCYGSTVYEKFRDACGSSEIVDGFLNRWLFLQSKVRPPRNEKVKFLEPPEGVLAQIEAIVAQSPYDAYGQPKPIEQRFTPEAWDIYLDYRRRIDAKVEESPYPLNSLLSRTMEHIEKVAHTLAEDNWTGIYDIKAAIKIVEFSNQCVAEFAGMISDNVHERDYVRVREIIKEEKEIKRSALVRKSQFIIGGAKRRKEIIDALIDDGAIVERELGGKLRTYKWIG